MFERYTEKARRTIFFARYEASQFGSPYIETEHLLLGLCREASGMLIRLATVENAFESLRSQVESRTPPRHGASASVDLPLSNECKRVLAYAAEEAERLAHRHIGAEHLLLGLLREKGCYAAELLSERGITLESARTFAQGLATPVLEPRATSLIEIHGRRHGGDQIRARAQELRKFAWRRQQLKAQDVLIERRTGKPMFYSGGDYDPERFELRPRGWPHEACSICNWVLFESDTPDHGTGYTNGREWICTECHDKFIVPSARTQDNDS